MKRVEFPDEGVIFTFPDGSDSTCVRNLGGPPSSWPGGNNKYKVKGFVFNFEFFNCNGGDLKLDDGFYLLVKYEKKHSDSARAKDEELTLGINKRNNQGWKEPMKDLKKKKYAKPVGKWNGSHKIKIDSWIDDPVVAWGP